MSLSFATYVNDLQADPDMLVHALLSYLAEQSDDLPPSHMRSQLIRAIGEATLRDLEQQFTQHSLLAENTALLILGAAWSQPDQQEAVRACIADSNHKLPVVEVGLISIVLSWGLYLWQTKGVRRHETTVIRKADGSLEERTVIELVDPSAPLNAIARALTQLPSSDEPAPTSPPQSTAAETASSNSAPTSQPRSASQE